MHIIHITLFAVSIQLCVHMFATNGVPLQQQLAYHCPQMCTCSIHMSLNMANCRWEKNLLLAVFFFPFLSYRSHSMNLQRKNLFCLSWQKINSDENLISANIGMPSPVEYLDISYNDITTIDNECFKVSEAITVKNYSKNKHRTSIVVALLGATAPANIAFASKFH